MYTSQAISGMNIPQSSSKLDAFMALAAKASPTKAAPQKLNIKPGKNSKSVNTSKAVKHPALRISKKTAKEHGAAKKAITAPAPKTNAGKTNKTYTVTDRGLEFAYKPDEDTAKINIDKISDKLSEDAKNLQMFKADLTNLRGLIAKVTKANQALRRIVMKTQSSDDLDVMCTFSGLRVPNEISDSVFRNSVRDFVRYVASKGLNLLNDASTISKSDIVDISNGVAAGRVLTKKMDIGSLIDAIKTEHSLDEDVQRLSHTVDEGKQKLDKTMQSGRVIRHSVAPDSVIDSKKQAVRVAELNVQSIESEVARLQTKIKLYKDVSKLSIPDLQKKIIELNGEITSLRSDYTKLAKDIAEARKSGSSTQRLTKIFDLQKETLDRRRSERLLRLQTKYSRLDAKTAGEKIKKEMAAWEKVEIANQKAINSDKGYVQQHKDLTTKSKNLEADSKKLESLMHSISDLETTLSYMRAASKFTAQERGLESERLNAIMSQKKQELKNAAKAINTRKAGLDSALDPDVWEANIEEKMNEAGFVKSAKAHMPINFIKNALEKGADKRTRSLIDFAWRYSKLGKKMKNTRGTKGTLNIAPVHFGKAGFVVDPRYMGLNSELVMVLQTALEQAYWNISESDISLTLLPAVLDSLRNTSESLAEHKKQFYKTLAPITKWLHSPKANTLLNETVESLLAMGKINTPDGTKPTKRYVSSVVDNMLSIIIDAKALNKLASFAWPSYRDEMSAWVRNKFKVEQKRTF